MTPEETLVQNERVAHALARGLVGAGVRHVVVSPGSRSTPLVLAFDSLAECTLHVVLDERAAAFMALGIGRKTGHPAVALATSGSAGANQFPAVVEANLGRVPLLVMTADRPGELQDCGASQTMSQRGLFGDHARACIAIPEPAVALSERWLQNIAARAVSTALGGPAGVVHLNVPFREPLYAPGQRPSVVSGGASSSVFRGRARLSPQDLTTLLDSLRAAASGAIVCGPMAPATSDGAELTEAVTALADALDWPVLADATSALRFGHGDASRIVTTADSLLRDEHLAETLRVAHVLRIGQQPTAKSVTTWLRGHAGALTLVDADGAWLDGGGVANRLVVAEAAQLCRELAAASSGSEGRPQNALTAAWLASDRAARAELDRHAAQGNWEGRIVYELVKSLPVGAHLHVASSMPIRDLESFSGARTDRIAITANRGVNGIDGTVATALGVALSGGGPTASLLGDLAFLHDLDGLEAAGALARTAGLQLVLVVVNNGGGGIFGELPIAQHPTAFERLFLTPRPGDLGGVARALELAHQSLTAEALPTALAGAFEKGGVHVLEVVVERGESSQLRRSAHAEASRVAREALVS